MTTIQVTVTLLGVALSAFIAWFFWFAPKGQMRAAVGTGGVQEVAVTVKGGYTPDIIVVKAGQPVRFHFNRQESSACSEMVLFPDFGKSASLHHAGQAGRVRLPVPDGHAARQADCRIT